MSSRVALVVNPTSGRGRGAVVGMDVAAHLRRRGHVVEDLTSGSAVEALGRARAAVAAGTDALVVVGGDGMVHLGAGAVAGSSVPLGVAAAGSGNDVARALGLPLLDAQASADVVHAGLVDGARRTVDAVRYEADGSAGWFVGVLGAGFDALVNERANRWTRPRGRLRYDLAIVRELPLFRPRRYRLCLDGEERDVTAVLLAVANGPSYGGGMRIAPDARVDDGLLDVVVCGPISRLELVRLYPSVFSGGHVDHPAVTVTRARHVVVDAPGIVGYADGERIAALPLTCEVVPGALDVLAPSGAADR